MYPAILKFSYFLKWNGVYPLNYVTESRLCFLFAFLILLSFFIFLPSVSFNEHNCSAEIMFIMFLLHFGKSLSLFVVYFNLFISNCIEDFILKERTKAESCLENIYKILLCVVLLLIWSRMIQHIQLLHVPSGLVYVSEFRWQE